MTTTANIATAACRSRLFKASTTIRASSTSEHSARPCSPRLRLGYVVIPEDLVDRFVAVRHAMDVAPPSFYQAVLTDFMNEGHFARHIRRMRILYGERRAALVEALRKEFGSDSGDSRRRSRDASGGDLA